MNTINGRFIECKISNYWSQCNKYCHDITLSEIENITATAVTSAGKAGNISELMRHFYTFYQEKFHQRDRCIPHIPQICTSLFFSHPLLAFHTTTSESFSLKTFLAKTFSSKTVTRVLHDCFCLDIILYFFNYNKSRQ